MKMTLHAISADELAKGFRDHTLCLPFETLRLFNSSSSFEIRGVLVQDEGKPVLQYMLTQSDGANALSAPVKRLTKKEDWWQAEGTTWNGVPLTLAGLTPPWNSTETENAWGKRTHVSTKVQRIVVHRADHCTDDILKIIHGEEKAAAAIEARKYHSSVNATARLANTKLCFVNTSTVFERKNVYFIHHASGWELDSLVGELECGAKFCFRNESGDVVIYLDSLDDCSLGSASEAQRALSGLVTAFAFMHGCHALAWRTEIMYNDHYEPDELAPHFKNLEGDIRTCRGSYETGHLDLAKRMTESAANYFSKDDPVVVKVRKFLWQMHTANNSRTVQLYECLLLCSIFEGITNLLLRSRAGWTDAHFKIATPKGKLRSKTAMERFEAIAAHYKIPWKGQFENVASTWRKPRNSLAHGDLFGATLENADVLFGIGPMIGGGILALMLADMGWAEPFDFNTLKKYGALYFST